MDLFSILRTLLDHHIQLEAVHEADVTKKAAAKALCLDLASSAESVGEFRFG